MVKNSLFYVKAIFIVLISFLTIGYIITSLESNLIYKTELNSLLLFLNDNNPHNNIITYLAKLLIRIIFNIDLGDLKSFYKNINPLY